jgi:hypothetical protein
MKMSVRLMLWFCRVVLRLLKSLVHAQGRIVNYQLPAGLEREFNTLMEDINDQLWQGQLDGKPPKIYED